MSSTALCLLLLALVGHQIDANPFVNKTLSYKTIPVPTETLRAVDTVINGGQDEICYPHIGCISKKTGPMNHTGILPFKLENIGTKFYAYKAGNSPSHEHIVDPEQRDTFNLIDANKRLVIVTHGFGNSYKTEMLVEVRDALLAHTGTEIGTVIMVDWEAGAKQPFYNEASANTQVVGRQIAYLVDQLKQHHSVRPAKVYLVGYSLGAQVSGFAGKFSRSKYGWKFGRITGLDAAAPLFEQHSGAYLTKDDADFVDAVHTSAGDNILKGEIGFKLPYAHLDFYPNGGSNQPQCKSIVKIGCNHHSSVLYYTASLKARSQCHFKGYKCPDYKSFQDGKCLRSDTELGYYSDKQSARGIHYLVTVKDYPYCHERA